MCVLLLDIGNTTVTWRMLTGTTWASEAVTVSSGDAAPEIERAAAERRARRAVAVTSAPEIALAVEDRLRRCGVEFLLAERDFPIPIATRYYDRGEIGRDRLCNALAAAELAGTPCISCSVGTCITVEAVDAQGVLVGGAIAAGMPSLRSGIAGTAPHLSPALGHASASPPSSTQLGRSTAENLRLGIWSQAAATVDRLVALARQAVGRHAPVLLTGGDAATVAGLCNEAYRVEPFLTLEGLRISYLRRPGATCEGA
ncbi:MAG: type III pantothenate kinase [Armatimonadetes bacterium]|nr:type III pantothenate kinase [Armatimonadota bacterium]